MHFPRIGSGKQPGNRDPVNNSNQSAPKKGRRGRRNSFHPNIQLPFEKIKPLTDLLPSAIDTDRTDSEGSSGSNTPVSQHLIQREELDTIVFDQCFTKSINSDILTLLSKNVDVEGSFNEFEFKNLKNVYSLEIENISNDVINNKTEASFPGTNKKNIILNTKLIDRWTRG